MGGPLPASTQWLVVDRAAEQLAPAHRGLLDEAAEGEVLHNSGLSAGLPAFFFAVFPPSPLPEWYAQRRRRLTMCQVDARFILTNGRRSRHILASRWQASLRRRGQGTTVQAWNEINDLT